MRQNLIVAVLAGLILSAVSVMAKSDWPPFAGIVRVDDLRSDVITLAIELKWDRYCDAEKTGNQMAERGIDGDIQGLQIQYAKLNSGREVPLRNCP